MDSVEVDNLPLVGRNAYRLLDPRPAFSRILSKIRLAFLPARIIMGRRMTWLAR